MFPEFATHVRKRTSALKLQMRSTTSGVRPPTTIQDGWPIMRSQLLGMV